MAVHAVDRKTLGMFHQGFELFQPRTVHTPPDVETLTSKKTMCTAVCMLRIYVERFTLDPPRWIFDI